MGYFIFSILDFLGSLIESLLVGDRSKQLFSFMDFIIYVDEGDDEQNKDIGKGAKLGKDAEHDLQSCHQSINY